MVSKKEKQTKQEFSVILIVPRKAYETFNRYTELQVVSKKVQQTILEFRVVLVVLHMGYQTTKGFTGLLVVP